MRAGANPTPLYEQLFEAAPLARLRLVGVALERLQMRADGQIAFTEVTSTDYADTGAVPGDTEDLINYPRSMDGVEVALIFIEQPEGGHEGQLPGAVGWTCRSWPSSSAAAGTSWPAGAGDDRDLPTVREAVLAAAEKCVAATRTPRE